MLTVGEEGWINKYDNGGDSLNNCARIIIYDAPRKCMGQGI